MGILFALLTAIFQSVQDVFAKRGLSQFSPLVVTFALGVYGLPLLFVGLCFSNPQIESLAFWLLLALLTASIDATGLFLAMKSISKSDLSLVIPLSSVSPVFAMLIAAAVFEEFPSTSGLLGIGLLLAGTYLLQIGGAKAGILEPFKRVWSDNGARLMVFACLLFGCAWNFHRAGLQYSNGIQWSIATFSIRTLILLPIVFPKLKAEGFYILRASGNLMLVGGACGMAFLSGVLALEYMLVAYVSSVKRVSILLSVLLGAILFKEQGLAERLLASVLMIAGVVLISVF